MERTITLTVDQQSDLLDALVARSEKATPAKYGEAEGNDPEDLPNYIAAARQLEAEICGPTTE
jgi:hypothetical protein